MNKISIIITSYRRLDFIKNLLDSIFSYTDFPNIEVIVSNSDPGYNKFKDPFLEKQSKSSHIKYVYSKPKQFMESVEEGYLKSTGDFILLLNDDCLIPDGDKDWLTKLWDYIKNREDVGSVSPYQFMSDMSFYTTGELDINLPGRTNGTRGKLEDRPKELEVVWNPFSCVLLKKSFIEQNRFLDVVPKPQYHYGSDSCYCRKIMEMGLKNITINSCWIYHFNNRTLIGYVNKRKYKYTGV